jgi:hypothetical protein
LSYHVLYEYEGYRLKDLPKKARYDVRKGLSVAGVEPISFERLASQGWRLRWETLLRQGRTQAESQADWCRLCLGAKDLPGFEAWAAIAEGKLVAALIAFTCESTFSILYQQSLTDYLSFGVNNALAFEVSSQALRRADIQRVFYGLHSLDAPPSVDQFKFRMGFTAKPVRQRVVIHPWIQQLANPISHALLRAGCKLLPGNNTLSKAEGLLRFYFQGQKYLAEQARPLPLRDFNLL